MSDAVFAFVGLAGCGGLLYLTLAPAREVLGGDESHMPTFRTSRASLGVHGHSYLTFLLWSVPINVAIILVCMLTLSSPTSALATVLPVIITLLVLLAIPFIALHITVNLFAWPKSLIPKAYRDRPSGLARWRTVSQQRRAGGPRTDHTVEIEEVRPLPDEDESEPYLMATCQEPGCGWMKFGDDDLDTDAQIAQLRRLGARHGQVAADVKRPVE
jgi:hypothetical protein